MDNWIAGKRGFVFRVLNFLKLSDEDEYYSEEEECEDEGEIVKSMFIILLGGLTAFLVMMLVLEAFA